MKEEKKKGREWRKKIHKREIFIKMNYVWIVNTRNEKGEVHIFSKYENKNQKHNQNLSSLKFRFPSIFIY